jgi:hypothetical protein
LQLIGLEYDAELHWPYWVDFEGALITRLPFHFIGPSGEPKELYYAEQSIFVPEPDDPRFARPLLPQEEIEDAVYITDGIATVYAPGDSRPTRQPAAAP